MGFKMKLFSARQAWHDAFYTQANSTMEAACEVLEPGNTACSGGGVTGSWKKTVFGHYPVDYA